MSFTSNRRGSEQNLGEEQELDFSNEYADADLSSGEEVVDQSTAHLGAGLRSGETESSDRGTRETGVPVSEATSSDYDADEEHGNGHLTNGHSSDEDAARNGRVGSQPLTARIVLKRVAASRMMRFSTTVEAPCKRMRK
jgi:hypothetical protein